MLHNVMLFRAILWCKPYFVKSLQKNIYQVKIIRGTNYCTNFVFHNLKIRGIEKKYLAQLYQKLNKLLII